MMKKVYICSPLGGNVSENLERVKRYTRYALMCGTAPIVPHFSALCQTMRMLLCVMMMAVMVTMTSVTTFAAGDVATAIENTWTAAQTQIKTVVNNVVFPVIDMILAIIFFVNLGTAYFDYRKHGQFEFTAPAILFACLIFTLTTPLYIWTIL